MKRIQKEKNKMSYLIRFKDTGNTRDPIVNKIRAAPSQEGWALTAGYIQWAKETFDAKLSKSVYGGFTSIKFKNEQDMAGFKAYFGLTEWIK